jgi:hypothetical protein
MIDYKKVEQAEKLLEESGVPYMLAYSKNNKHFSSKVNGEYPMVKNFVITAMWQIIKDVYNQCGSGAATSEAFAIASAVIERLRAMEEVKEQ